jgi:hypothetical protein
LGFVHNRKNKGSLREGSLIVLPVGFRPA